MGLSLFFNYLCCDLNRAITRSFEMLSNDYEKTKFCLTNLIFAARFASKRYANDLGEISKNI